MTYLGRVLRVKLPVLAAGALDHPAQLPEVLDQVVGARGLQFPAPLNPPANPHVRTPAALKPVRTWVTQGLEKNAPVRILDAVTTYYWQVRHGLGFPHRTYVRQGAGGCSAVDGGGSPSPYTPHAYARELSPPGIIGM